MRIYSLSRLGARVVSDRSGNSEELRVLDYLAENPTASDDQLEIAGADRITIRIMARRGLIKELTSA